MAKESAVRLEEKSIVDEEKVDKVDEKLPLGQLIPLGLQHVLAMYAGAVAVPLIVGGSVGLTPQQLSLLVAADLFTCGIATLIQALGIGNFAGAKLPAILGVTFAAVGPLITIGSSSGMQAAYGGIMVAGLIVILIAPFYGKLLRFFPNVVTGSVVTIIGLTLIPVGINNAAGGVGSENFGDLRNLLLALFVAAIVLIMNKYFKGFLQAISVLIGLIIGTIVASFLGMVDFTEVVNAKWVSIVHPFAFGIPKFEFSAILLMTIVMIVVMIESTGAYLAIGKICGKNLTEKDIVKGMRAEGLATICGGIFNSFPYTTFSQNVGLLTLSKVTSRWVVVAAGCILILLGTIPKFAALATIIPAPVFGGATTIMFAMVAVSGIRMLSSVDFSKNGNLLVVACSLAVGLGVEVVPDLLKYTPEMFKMVFESGIVAGSITAVILNAFLNYGDKDSIGTAESVEIKDDTII